jgi:hypothetical protein
MDLDRQLSVVLFAQMPLELGLEGEGELTFRTPVHRHLDSSVFDDCADSETLGFEVDVKFSSR